MEYVMEARQSQFLRESTGELAMNLDTHNILYLLEHILHLKLFTKSKELFSELSDVNYIVHSVNN